MVVTESIEPRDAYAQYGKANFSLLAMLIPLEESNQGTGRTQMKRQTDWGIQVKKYDGKLNKDENFLQVTGYANAYYACAVQGLPVDSIIRTVNGLPVKSFEHGIRLLEQCSGAHPHTM